MSVQVELPINQELSLIHEGLKFIPVRLISRGEHSLIYVVKTEGGYCALKWFKVQGNVEYESFLDSILNRIAQVELPHKSFLWPSAVCVKPCNLHHPENHTFGGIGYFMRLKGKKFLDSIGYVNGIFKINESNLMKACSNIASAIACLHNKKMFHRDISLNNILIDSSSGQIQICDNEFVGLLQMHGSRKIEPQIDQALKGTPGFIAPENFHHSRHSANTDNYSLAAVIYSLLTGTHIKKLGTSDDFPTIDLLNIPSWKKSEIKKLLHCALGKDQHNSPRRPTAREWHELLSES